MIWNRCVCWKQYHRIAPGGWQMDTPKRINFEHHWGSLGFNKALLKIKMVQPFSTSNGAKTHSHSPQLVSKYGAHAFAVHIDERNQLLIELKCFQNWGYIFKILSIHMHILSIMLPSETVAEILPRWPPQQLCENLESWGVKSVDWPVFK